MFLRTTLEAKIGEKPLVDQDFSERDITTSGGHLEGNPSNLNIMPAPDIDDTQGGGMDDWIRSRIRRGKCSQLTAGELEDRRENGNALVGVVLGTTLAQVCDMVCAQDMEGVATVYNMTVDEADCLECFGAIAARCLRLAKQIPLVSELVPNTNTNCVACTDDDSDWQLTGVFIILTLWFVVYAYSRLGMAKESTASAGASDPDRVPRKRMSVDFDEAHAAHCEPRKTMSIDFDESRGSVVFSSPGSRGSEVSNSRESITEL